MQQIYIRSPSPSDLNAIERLEASPGDPHLRIYRAVIKQDIRKLSEHEDEIEDADNGREEDDDGEGAEADKEDEQECDDGDDKEEDDEEDNEEENEEKYDEDDDDVDPREKIDIGKHPIEYYVYEVLVQKHGDSISYFIFSAKYSMEDGDAEHWCNDVATREEAIAHVVEALSYEDAESPEEESELDWTSKAAGEEIPFPSEDELIDYWDENEEEIERDAQNSGW